MRKQASLPHPPAWTSAEWLVDKASVAAEATSGPNATGRVLELGGSVSAERTGGPDHSPTFTAIAELGGTRLSVTGRSKTEAKQKASVKLLEQAHKNAIHTE